MDNQWFAVQTLLFIVIVVQFSTLICLFHGCRDPYICNSEAKGFVHWVEAKPLRDDVLSGIALNKKTVQYREHND